ncbi:unnamed protein product [Rhodiola kirilowii]
MERPWTVVESTRGGRERDWAAAQPPCVMTNVSFR